MTVAELFVNIGLKGADQTGKALKDIQGGMKEVGSSGLAVKAAIFGVIYGIERMTEAAATAGSDLEKFNAVTGLSLRTMQEFQHIGTKFNVGRNEIMGAVVALQQLQQQFRTFGTLPQGFALLGINPNQDPFEMLKKLADLSKTMDPQKFAFAMRAAGISDNITQMLRRMDFDRDRLGAPIKSEDQLESLARTRQEIDQLHERFASLAQDVTAKYGPMIYKGIEDAFSGVEKLVHIFEKIDKSTKGIGELFRLLGEIVVAAFNPAVGVGLLGIHGLQTFNRSTDRSGNFSQKDFDKNYPTVKKIIDFRNGVDDAFFAGMRDFAKAYADAVSVNNNGNQGTITVNQIFDVDKHDAPKVSVDAVHEAVRTATHYRSGATGKR